MKQWNWILTVAAVGLATGIVGYMVGSAGSKTDGPPVAQNVIDEAPSAALGLEWCPSKGPANAKVTVLEFTDFQ